MNFTNPSVLLLLLLLPIFIVIGWPRLLHRRLRDSVSLIIRLLLVILLILGLAQIEIRRTADKLAVVFLIDVSDSISEAARSASIQYVQTSLESMDENDQAAVVVFGADAMIESSMSDRVELVQLGTEEEVNQLNTDLAEAMRVGLALFPADTAKRMIILSDGRQTIGDAEEVARLAAATNVQIDYVSLLPDNTGEQVDGPEILVTDVQAPSTVNEGEKFDLTITVGSNRDNSEAEMQVLASGTEIYRQNIVLHQGLNEYVLRDIVMPTAGFVDFRVVLTPTSADHFYQNNQLSAFTEVTGAPRVLLVTTDNREIEALQPALEATGLQIDVADALPLGLAPLSSYDCIVLANMPATDLSPDEMNYLQAYVRDLGGGLVVIGGPNSYGVGGYFETPLEETLPVDMRLRDQERIPEITMLFVIDRSGSMEIANASGVSNLELAKEATARSLSLLNDTDRAGVISFDVSAYFVLDIQDVGDETHREEMRNTIGSLRPGGGTNIRQAVLSADQVLRSDPSEIKHIILLTDGGSDPSGIVAAIDRMYQNYGITTSVVAVGRDYAPWLETAATAGHGQFHLAYDVSTIPAIFTAETMMAARVYIYEEQFNPTLTADSPIMRGIDSVPPLDGYVATTEKDTATVIMRGGPEEDPILASWQYGLGRSVAFTSDASSRWAPSWISWPGYGDFWGQAIRWAIGEQSTSNVEAHVVQRGEDAVLVVEARDSQGGYLNGLQLNGSVTNAQLDTNTMTLQQTAPGRYEGVFNPAQEGSYFITVAGSTPPDSNVLRPESVIQTTGWVLSYSGEFRVDVTGTEQAEPITLLRRISNVTGGRSLKDKPDRAFLHDLNQERAAQPIWPYFILAALLLLPIDIAVRRLVITQTDIQKLRAFFSGRKVDVTEPSARMERLMGAKGRARPAAQPPGMEAPPIAPSSVTSNPRRLPRVPQIHAPKASAPKPQPSEPQPREENSLASRLLEKRRQDKDDS
jgi:uncharacterized membrane protein